MDIKYTEILSSLKRSEKILNDYLENYNSEQISNEDENINNKLYETQEKINNVTWLINYYNKPFKEGYLKLQQNGRFKIFDEELTCGSHLEIEFNNSWHFGVVEFNNGYYFLNEELGNPKLTDTIYARIRE